MSPARASVAVVTGGASGIGAAVARVLRARGDDVVVLDRAAEIALARGMQLSVDIGDERAVDDAFDQVIATYGQLDILAHCAGIDTSAPITQTSLDEWDRVQRTNSTGTFLCVRAAARIMSRQRRGSIVCISSINAELGFRTRATYSASKGAVTAFCRAAAHELGAYGIRVNVVAPGAIDTPIWNGTLTEEARRAQAQRSALGYVGDPIEVAHVVRFLTSPEASYMTGAVLPVCGGRSTTDYLPEEPS